jgi:hypothetical protein
VDLLALLGAALTAWAAYSWLFHRTEVPRAVDPLLGSALEVRFDADLPWKESFAPAGSTVLVDGLLRSRVEEAGPAEGGPPARRRLRIRVLAREGQDPVTMTDFRWGVWRGSVVALQDEGGPGGVVSTVNAEVIAVEPARKP